MLLPSRPRTGAGTLRHLGLRLLCDRGSAADSFARPSHFPRNAFVSMFPFQTADSRNSLDKLREIHSEKVAGVTLVVPVQLSLSCGERLANLTMRELVVGALRAPLHRP